MGCTNSKSSEVMSRSGGNTGVGGIREATSTSNATTKNIPSIPDEVADLFNHNNNPAGIIVRDKIEDLQEATTVITDTVNTIRSVSEELNEIVSNDVSPKQQESHGDGHTLSLDKSVKSAGSEEDGETLVPAGAAAGAVTESDSHAPDPMEGDGGDPNDKGVEEAKRDAELLSPSSDRPQTPEPRQEEQEQAMENSSLAEVDIYRVEVPSTAGSIRGSEPDHDALAEVSEQEEKDQEEPEQRESKANAGEGRAGKDESASLVTGTEEKGSEVVPDGNGSSSASSSTSVRSVKSVKGAHPLVNGNNNTASNHHPHHHLRKLSSSISLGGSNSGKKGQPSGSSKNRAESGKGTTTRKSSSASIHKESMHS